MLLIICIAAGYLLGSLNFSIIISKLKGKDIRQFGSGNAGATNTARLFGMKTGITVLAADMLKTGVSALAGYLIAGRTGLIAACAACLVGHIFPCFFGFRGGKGVSVSSCIVLIFDPPLFLMVFGIFTLVFLTDRRVSLCSIISAVSLPVLWLVTGNGTGAGFALCCLIAIVIVCTHRENIKRIINGTEPRFKPAKGNRNWKTENEREDTGN